MGEKPPPYDQTNSPSAPPAYFQSLPGDETKGIDWSLNSSPRPPPRYIARPAPSAPPISDAGTSSSSKSIDWSLNTPQPPTRTVSRPNHPGYSGSSSHHPVYPGSNAQPSSHHPSPGSSKGRSSFPAASHPGTTPEPTNPYLKWKTEFSRHYPGAKLSRDTPSILKVEIPKNRAFPVMGHATCPDCFDNGPHQTQFVKKKDGILSVKKLPAQKCRHCSKLVYFIHSDNLVEDHVPRDKPPPYTNRPSQMGFNNNPHLADNFGHGWGSGEDGHGWNPGEGEGHGWGR